MSGPVPQNAGNHNAAVHHTRHDDYDTGNNDNDHNDNHNNDDYHDDGEDRHDDNDHNDNFDNRHNDDNDHRHNDTVNNQAQKARHAENRRRIQSDALCADRHGVLRRPVPSGAALYAEHQPIDQRRLIHPIRTNQTPLKKVKATDDEIFI